MSSSAFSFHCMICFEEFDTQTNYPVVLPCGHTYVCVECANRLDKCMECRMPLTMKLEPPNPPPAQQMSRVDEGMGGVGGPPIIPHDSHKENQKNRYADRVRNSPGFRRRYGHLEEYSDGGRNGNNYNKRGGGPSGSPHQPPSPVPKVRLPLPKNAVLLSLIQASEPARRRAEVEAPTTPQKSDQHGLISPPRMSHNNNAASGASPPSNNASLPHFSRPSPLFHHDGSSSGDHHDNNNMPHPPAHHLLGSSSFVDDEEHKIRVGTYLEGGPCGTYAVASRNGLLVYPTLFEHTLPRSLDGVGGGGHESDAVTRDVEMVVKNYYKENRGAAAANTGNKQSGGWADVESISARLRPPPPPPSRPPPLVNAGGASPLSTTVVENHDDENVEAHCYETESDTNLVGDGIDLTQLEDENDGTDSYSVSDVGGGSGGSEAGPGVESCTSDPGPPRSRLSSLRTKSSHPPRDDDERGTTTVPTVDVVMPSSGDDDVEDDFGVGVGLNVSYSAVGSDDEIDSDDEGEFGDSVSDIGGGPIPPRLQPQGVYSRSTSDVGAYTSSPGGTKKIFKRQFSQGANNKVTTTGNNSNNDDFERPLVRLKYGDRVQVVSMDSRGWVKLARGYGYIRLENDKQLVKVGGTSDKACQIEAMLHELSIERNRLKHEQMKLERLSAGLMIDLQSSLLTSDDNVVVSAPVGMTRSDSELSLTRPRGDSELNLGSTKVSLDDIAVSGRSPETNCSQKQLEREIRTAKSHSPGRSHSLALSSSTPPSPPYSQIAGNPILNTPTRVNFRTGMSGHRALTSSHSHPHDFIGGGTIRSMSNHAGISTTVKKTDRRGRSIY